MVSTNKNIIGQMFPEVWKQKTIQNNCGDESSMVLLYDGHLGDTIIDGNTEPSGNIIIKSIELVLSYPHIGIHTGDTE